MSKNRDFPSYKIFWFHSFKVYTMYYAGSFMLDVKRSVYFLQIQMQISTKMSFYCVLMQWVWDLSSRRRRLKTFFDIFILWTFCYIRPLAARDDDVEVTAAVGDRKDIFLMMFLPQVFLFATLLKSYQMWMKSNRNNE